MRTKKGIKELITGILIGEGLLITDLEENAVDRIIEALTKENNLIIPDISQRSELLPDFLYEDYGIIRVGVHGDSAVTDEWNDYLKKLGNCR